MFASPLHKVVFGLKDRVTGRGDTAALVAELDRSQWHSRAELEELQTQKMRRLVRHCYDHVPYYRRVFEREGLVPEDFVRLQDLKRLPVLEKTQLRQHTDELFAAPERFHKASTVVRTSGSTGDRLVFRLGPDTLRHHLANSIRGRLWWDMRVGENELKFWGISTPFEQTFKGKSLSLAKRLKDRLLAVTHLSPFDMSEERLQGHCRTLLAKRPRLIFGYGGAIYLFARYLADRQVDLGGYRPGAVIYTSETVYPSQKELIERVFGAPLVCEYGSVECGIIAYQCREGSLHLMDETLYVEAVEGAGGGDRELVVTHLENFLFPLLRYRLGDLGELSAAGCPCGRHLTVLERLAGRANDVVYTPGGDPVHPELFDYVMRHQEGVRRFRVVEKGRGHLDILLETRGDLPQEQLDGLRRAFGEQLGHDFRIDFSQVESIPNEPSGKFRWVVAQNR